MWPNPHFPADLVTFTEEILNGKLNLFFFLQWFFNESFPIHHYKLFSTLFHLYDLCVHFDQECCSICHCWVLKPFLKLYIRMIKIYQLVSVSLKIQLHCCSYQWCKSFHLFLRFFCHYQKISKVLQKLLVFQIYYQFFIVKNSNLIPGIFYFR